MARQGSSGSMCTTANNQREVYGSVVVQDWEVDGGEGNVTLNIANIIFNLTSSEFIELTGCREGIYYTHALLPRVDWLANLLLLLPCIQWVPL